MAVDRTSPSHSRDHPLLGIALRSGAVVCFALMSAMLKLASEDHVVAGEMLFYRAAFGLPVVLAWLLLGPGLTSVRTTRPAAHLGRSILGIASILCTFQALILLSLPDATTIGFTSPIFATIVSALLLGERVGPHRWWAVALGFIGVIVVMRPGGGGETSHPGIAIALLAALGTSGVVITLRKLGSTEAPGAIVFWFFICSLIVGAVMLPVLGSTHQPHTYLLLAMGGLAGGLAQLCLTASLRVAPVSVLAPFDYVQIVWAIALNWLIWTREPSLNTMMGAMLIAASGLYTAWREQRLRRDNIPASPVVNE